MKQYIINSDTKLIDNTPFINYTDGNFTFLQGENFTFIKNYRRGQSDLSNFIRDFENKWKIYINNFDNLAGINTYTIEFKKLHDELIRIFNNFIQSFNENKRHIDNDKDEEEEYIYRGGRTELRIKLLNAVQIKQDIVMRKTKDKNINKLNSVNNQVNVFYKLQQTYLRSNRW